MDLVISSEKIANNLLIELLRKLSESFISMNQNFFVIGATARDIMCQLADVSPMRKTRALDIAIAIPNWKRYRLLITQNKS